jgi:hypothetical protein
MKIPLDTSKLNPIINFGVAMSSGLETLCTEQMAHGQSDLTSCDVLPTRTLGRNDKEILERAGVKFLGPVEGDSLFQMVELPPGWTKRRTSHHLWTDLLDSNGRVRAAIFYSAVFYDRDAHFYATSRYSTDTEYHIPEPGFEMVPEYQAGHPDSNEYFDIMGMVHYSRPMPKMVKRVLEPIAATGLVKDGDIIIHRTIRFDAESKYPYRVGKILGHIGHDRP